MAFLTLFEMSLIEQPCVAFSRSIGQTQTAGVEEACCVSGADEAAVDGMACSGPAGFILHSVNKFNTRG